MHDDNDKDDRNGFLGNLFISRSETSTVATFLIMFGSFLTIECCSLLPTTDRPSVECIVRSCVVAGSTGFLLSLSLHYLLVR